MKISVNAKTRSQSKNDVHNIKFNDDGNILIEEKQMRKKG